MFFYRINKLMLKSINLVKKKNTKTFVEYHVLHTNIGMLYIKNKNTKVIR